MFTAISQHLDILSQSDIGILIREPGETSDPYRKDAIS